MTYIELADKIVQALRAGPMSVDHIYDFSRDTLGKDTPPFAVGATTTLAVALLYTRRIITKTDTQIQLIDA